jgi:cytochrome b6-f complex iron-sulfur subunit
VTVLLGPSSPLATVGGLAIVAMQTGAFLLAARTSPNTFTALSATCTHQACTISAYTGRTFVCPCHGSEFDTSGRLISGPAATPLAQFATSFADNTLTIAI